MNIQYEYSVQKVSAHRYVVQQRVIGDAGKFNAGMFFPLSEVPEKKQVPYAKVCGIVTKRLRWEQAMEVFYFIQEHGS